MISDNLRRTVADVRVKRGAELATDHHLVVCIVQLSSNCTVQKVKSKKMNRIKWEALANGETRRKFITKVDQNILIPHMDRRKEHGGLKKSAK
jgi:hypothetical protein